MEKEKFVDVLTKMQKSLDYNSKLYDEFGIDTTSLPTTETCGWLFDFLWEEVLTEDGINVLYCYFFDYLNIECSLQSLKEDYTPIDYKIEGKLIKNYGDMYDYLVENKLFKH